MPTSTAFDAGFRESDWDSPYESGEALGKLFAGTLGTGKPGILSRSAEIATKPLD